MMIYVANWKTYLNYEDTLNFYKTHGGKLEQLVREHQSTFIICPPLIALAPLAAMISNAPIKLGSQLSSNQGLGSYTGQIDALSLAQIGCSYALVNHSEVRLLLKDPDHFMIGQITQLIQNRISPIICMGETDYEYEIGKTEAVLTETLHTLQQILSTIGVPYLLAYEPIWAIGNTNIPTSQDLSMTKHHIIKTLQKLMIPFPKAYLYGGSVNSNTIQILKQSGLFDGYLIGRASIDFQTLEKIVS